MCMDKPTDIKDFIYIYMYSEFLLISVGSCIGDSGGVVKSLAFCPSPFKSLGCFYFRCRTFFTMEGGDNEFANFTLPTLKTFLVARSHNLSGNKQ